MQTALKFEPKTYTVTEFNELVNETLREHVGEVLISGEISGLSIRQNKWITFSLRDESSTVNCFGVVGKIGINIEDGMHVKILGAPRIYVPYGRYSLNVNAIEPIGVGALQRAYELLVAKLQSEGLFEEKHKQALPHYPSRIGLITSKDGAALGDVRKVLSDRWGNFTLTLAPVQVQGIDAPKQVTNAVRWFNDQHPVDVLILTRGGGSLEDLQAFNDEVVARTVFSSKIPIIAAIGHEQDITIAELVADKRASTPSNAAQLAVPDWRTVNAELEAINTRLRSHILSELQAKHASLKHVMQLARQIRERALEKTTHWSLRFQQLLIQYAHERKLVYANLEQQKKQIIFQTNLRQQQASERLRKAQAILRALSPTGILKRGYTFTIDSASGRILTSATHVKFGQRITTQFHDGTVNSEVLVQ